MAFATCAKDNETVQSLDDASMTAIITDTLQNFAKDQIEKHNQPALNVLLQPGSLLCYLISKVVDPYRSLYDNDFIGVHDGS